MTNITFREVAKRFGDVRAIEKLNLEVREHELMVLVGPSGCGKTTALRLIAGLEDITEGQLLIGDRLVNDVHPKDRDVAMVFQSYALYPHMTVRENIAFGLRMRKVSPPKIEQLVNEAADILGLTELLDRKPKALSGGQRQRVALGRAVVRQPAVFLFDEPLSNLDADLRVQMRAELSKLQYRLKTTTVYVTHDQVEAMTLGHRIAVFAPLHKDATRSLQQVGTPLELYEHPDNVFVARFIGTPAMNMLTVTVGADGRLTGPGFNAAPPADVVLSLRDYAGKRVRLGVRPEHVGTPDAHDWPRKSVVRGSVEIVETIGHETIVHVRLGRDTLIARLGTHRPPRFGETLELAVNCDALHLFDDVSEKRIGSVEVEQA